MAVVDQESIPQELEAVYVKTELEWDDTLQDMQVETDITQLEPKSKITESSVIKVKVEPLPETEVPEQQHSAVKTSVKMQDCQPGANGCKQELSSESDEEDQSLSVSLVPKKLKNNPKTRKPRKIIACEVCQRQFPKTSHLKRHLRVHTGEKPYSCDVCQKQFGHLFAFNRHTRNHIGEKPHRCDVCEKQFTQLHNLLTHKRIHTGEKPYVCEVCQKSFIKSTDLIKHKRIHTGEKPFGCQICNKQFTSSGNLTKHIRTHTGEKRHCCEKCDKQFTKRIYLEKHALLHTEDKLWPTAHIRCKRRDQLKQRKPMDGQPERTEGLKESVDTGFRDPKID